MTANDDLDHPPLAEPTPLVAPEAAVEPDRGPMHMPVEVRSVALIVIAVLAGLYALHWAREVVVPVLLGTMASYALTPLVDRLYAWRVPRAAAAGAVLLAALGAVGWGVWSLGDDAASLVDSLPQVAQKVRQTLNAGGGKKALPAQTLERVQQAAVELQQAAIESAVGGASGASGAGSSAATRGGPPAKKRLPELEAPIADLPQVPVQRVTINIRDYVWSGTLGLLAFVGQMIIVVFIAFFLLASGDTFRRKMVKLAGPTLSQKKITVQALDEIHAQIQTYLVVQVAMSALVALLTWLAFLAIGLNHAAVWGVVAGITNLIPYVGAVIVGVVSTVVGLVQFNALDMGLLVGAASFGIHTVVGNLITPWLTGRTNRMNPFVVFIAVLLFGWLWGVVGLLLGVPILVVVKTVCDRVEELKPVGELISG